MGEQCPEDLRTVNLVIGEFLKHWRQQRRRSRDELASHIGVSVRELEEIETGDSPISAARLYRAGSMLRVHVAAFFDPYYNPEIYDS